MSDHIEDKLKEEIIAETPDLLEDLLRECGFSEDSSANEQGSEENSTQIEAAESETTKVIPLGPARRRRFRILGGTAAAALLIAAGILLYQSGLRHGAEQEHIRYSAEAQTQENAEKTAQIENAASEKEEKIPAAVVSLDVNPSVEMTIDRTNHVLTWKAVNSDAEKILEGLDLAGSDIKVAAYAIVGAMLTNGYLNEDVNSVLVSVVSADEEKGLELERGLSEALNGYLEESSISAAVFGQYAGDDEEVKQFALAHHLSYGKAWLIRTLLSEDPRLKEGSLLQLSTQELLLLWERQPEEPDAENRTVYGSVSIDRYIPSQEALQAALEYAGLTEEEISDPTIEISCEDGIIIYEVEFRYGSREYEIDINAVSGEMVESEFDPFRPDEQTERTQETDEAPDDPEEDDIDDTDDTDDNDDAEDDDIDRDDAEEEGSDDNEPDEDQDEPDDRDDDEGENDDSDDDDD